MAPLRARPVVPSTILALAALALGALPAGAEDAVAPPETFPGGSTWVSRLRDDRAQPVGDAVVSLVPLDRPSPPPPEVPARVRIAQAGMEYRPAVTAVRVGTTIEFPNLDDIQHHLYSVSRPKRFEKPLYPPGAAEEVVFDQPGVVLLGCNIHDWMSAHVVVLETPWFALSDADGEARIPGVPPGRYRLEIWHARLARPVTADVEVSAADAPPRSDGLVLRPDRRARRAPTPDRPGGY